MQPLPIEALLNSLIQAMTTGGEPVFSLISQVVLGMNSGLKFVLTQTPPVALIVALAAFTWWRRNSSSALTVLISLSIILNLELWRQALDTISLVAVSTFLSVVIGVPLGVLCAERAAVRNAVLPVLDFMQSTPSFVYLAPSVAFFSIGAVPGVLVTVMFALPPVVRSIELGILQVNSEIVEASEAFGSSKFQTLLMVKLPLSARYFFLAVNQSIMMALNVVVMASLVGAPGLGVEVITALAQLDLSRGIEAGTAIVLLAIALDQLTSMPMAKAVRRKISPGNAKLSPESAHA